MDGDKVVCFVDQLKLGSECRRRRYGDLTTDYDCIYSHRWTLKARGKVCEKFYGPYSSEIKKASFQCKKEDD